MTEKTIKEADRTMLDHDDENSRFNESVDTTKTPKEEREDPKRKEQGRPEATSL